MGGRAHRGAVEKINEIGKILKMLGGRRCLKKKKAKKGSRKFGGGE